MILSNSKYFVFQMVAKHFHSMEVEEKEALAYFIYVAKNFKNRLDHPRPIESGTS